MRGWLPGALVLCAAVAFNNDYYWQGGALIALAWIVVKVTR